MSATTHLITADEFLTMPQLDKGGDLRSELIRGELKAMSPTGGIHGIISLWLGALILNHVTANKLGRAFGAETGFLVEQDPDTVLGADVAYVSKERMKSVKNIEKYIPFAPDIAVEVLSPGNTALEMDEKVALYFSAGARAVWIVNPRRKTISVYDSPLDLRILGEKDTLDAGKILPGFKLALAELFAVAENRDV
ncbi:MAG: Uma2 family endonuclease [Acidobacteria bacterium]|nr:Uma2 family endonuclease [Acidobacteriota bacterium]